MLILLLRFSAFLLLCFSVFCFPCFSASLLLCFPCFFAFRLLCFCAFLLLLFLCFSARFLSLLSLCCSFSFASFSPVSATLRQIPGRPPKIWETDICQPITYHLDFFANYQKTRTNICCFSFFPVCLIKITPYNIHDTKYDSKNVMCLILRLLLSAFYILIHLCIRMSAHGISLPYIRS